MEDIVVRIKEVMENEGMSAAEFADHLGIGRPLLSHVLGGRNNPSLQLVLKILNHFPAYSANWLIQGIKEKTEQSTEPVVKQNIVEKAATVVPKQMRPNSSLSQRALLFYGDGTFEEYKARK
jgi:transcriptional regulator with XRE-family HTH domain